MASEVSIVNRALSVLGARSITAMTDDTVQARLANSLYADTRDTVLRAHPWNFATKRAELALLAAAPVFGWDAAFQLPVDCLKVLSVNDDEEAGTTGDVFKIEGRTLMANTTSVFIRYIAQITDVGQFDALFSRALSFALAADMAYAITGSTTVTQGMQALYEFRLKEARSVDGQEGTADSQNDSTLLSVR